MKTLTRMWRRWRDGERVERELDAEIGAYLDGVADEKAGSGIAREEARRQAVAESGGGEQLKELVREARAGFVLEQLWRDFCYGLRGLRRAPGFTAVAIATMGLGIGVSTAIFSVVDTVLLRPLPYFEPERLAMIYEGPSGRTVLAATEVNTFSAAKGVEAIAGIQPMNVTVLGGEQPEQVTGALVSASFFRTLRVQPLIGRLFLPEEDKSGAAQVAILSEALWTRRFGADPHIAGKPAMFEVNEMWGISPNRQQSFVIVGVVPNSFRTLVRGTEGEVWFPLAAGDSANHDLFTLARLRPGVTTAQLRHELEALVAPIRERVHSDARSEPLTVLPLIDDLLGDWRRALVVLAGAVACVVLIASGNLGSLLALRAEARKRELAIRAALGAARARLVRQTLTESATLCVMGGAVGLAVAYWGIQLLGAASPAGIARMEDVRLDARVLLFAMVFTVVTAAGAGLIGTLRLSRVADFHELRGSRGALGAGAGRTRAVLVIAQVAIALVLMIGSGLMLRTLAGYLHAETGFSAQSVATMRISLPKNRYAKGSLRAPFFEPLFERVRALPGVEAVAVNSTMPFGGVSMGVGVSRTTDSRLLDARLQMVSAEYFRVLRIPLLRGREFTAEDLRDADVKAILNQALAEQLFGHDDPIGRQVHLRDNPPFTVVGVVGNTRDEGFAETPRVIYFGVYPRAGGVLIRSSSPLETLLPAVRKAAAELDNAVAPYDAQLMEQRVTASFSVQRYTAVLLTLFAGTALFLGAVGLYGVISFSVNRRVNEIGVRVALGASRGAVMRMVLKQGMALVGIGLGIGLAGAYGLTRVLAGLLFGVTAQDTATFVVYAAVLTVVGFLAVVIPARRASRVDPLTALRLE